MFDFFYSELCYMFLVHFCKIFILSNYDDMIKIRLKYYLILLLATILYMNNRFSHSIYVEGWLGVCRWTLFDQKCPSISILRLNV